MQLFGNPYVLIKTCNLIFLIVVTIFVMLTKLLNIIVITIIFNNIFLFNGIKVRYQIRISVEVIR